MRELLATRNQPTGAIWLALLMTLTMVLAACGGGGDDGSGGGGRAQLTDPASAPTATPVPDDQATVIQVGDGASGGSGTIIDDGGDSSDGGPSGNTSSGRTYTVVAGDTCIGIANANGVTVEGLQEANSELGDVCSALFPDMTINLPAPPRDESNDGDTNGDSGGRGNDSDDDRNDDDADNDNSSGETEEIQAGDTCGAIASRLGVTDDELKDANPGLDCSFLIAGTTVNVP